MKRSALSWSNLSPPPSSAPALAPPAFWGVLATAGGAAQRCCGGEPSGDQEHVPPLFAALRPKTPPTNKALDGDCGCEKTTPLGKERRPADGSPRVVSGTWLASVLTLRCEVAAAIEGQQVEVDEEAWEAVQAALSARTDWQATRRKTTKRRVKLFSPRRPVERPDLWAQMKRSKGAALPNPAGSIEIPAPCDFGVHVRVGPRFVDSVSGDDLNSGEIELGPGTGLSLKATVKPWKTLAQVAIWLNTDVYGGASPGSTGVLGAWVFLRRGRTWDGSEENPGSTPAYDWESRGVAVALEVLSLKASESWPLILSAYGPEALEPRDNRPIIDGCATRTTGALYQDVRAGLRFRDCCHVYVSQLRIRGFGDAIEVRGGSRSQVFAHLNVYDNARWGVHIGVDVADAAAYGSDVATQLRAINSLQQYPQDITVTECRLRSNGYDTAGADIGLGALATNCTLSYNHMTGDSVRGMDGVVSQGGSSGHLIEGNRISSHNKWCREASDKAVLVSTAAECGGPTLFQSCEGPPHPYCVSTPYGYSRLNYRSGDLPPAAVGDEAFGEDGIDLKGVRPRTPTSADVTVICNNVIWGHTNFSGITIADGTQGVHIFRNRIFQNATGLYIGNGDNSGWYNAADPDYRDKKTEQIYVYRNLVYMNEGRGVHVEGTFDSGYEFKVDHVHIIGNTIAHNLWVGVHVTDAASGRPGPVPMVNRVTLVNNLIMRNGIAFYGITDPLGMQAAWDSTIRLTSSRVWSDFNCYLGWPPAAGGGTLPDVVAWGTSYNTQSALPSTFGVEYDGVQVSTLEELELAGESALITAEGVSPAGQSLYDNVTENYSAHQVERLDYDLASWVSPCVGAGTPNTSVTQLDSTDDIALSSDLEDQPVFDGVPDIGAFETLFRT